MMLYYKAWRESRLGFLLSFSALIVFCFVYALFPRQDPLHRFTYRQITYAETYCGAIRNIFIVLSLLLGLGGLLRERSHGTVLFTLSIPVSRLRHVEARVVVGLAELALLALVPAVLLPVFGIWSHQNYPSFSQALAFSVLWIGGGIVLFAWGFFLSTVVPGDYPAATACLISLFVYVMPLFMLWVKVKPSLDLFNVMSGLHMPYFSGPISADWWECGTCSIVWIPWGILVRLALVALAVLAAAWQVVEHQDF